MNSCKDTILVVDNDRDNCELIQFLLAYAQINIEIAVSGVEATELLQENRYSAVVMAVYLPGVSGLDVCRQLRRFDRATPVIFFSGAVSAIDRSEGLSAGAQAYLIKPDDLDNIAGTVMSMVWKRKHAEAA